MSSKCLILIKEADLISNNLDTGKQEQNKVCRIFLQTGNNQRLGNAGWMIAK